MGVRIASTASTALVTAVLGGNANTLGLQTGSIGLIQDNAQILIYWYAVILFGAGLTAMDLKVLRGNTTAGTRVNVANSITVTAATIMQFSGCYVDTPGVAALAQYNITFNPTGAAANSTLLDGCIAALIL